VTGVQTCALPIFLTTGFTIAIIKAESTLMRDHLVSSQKEWVDTLAQTVAEAVAMDVINDEKLHVADLLRRMVSKDRSLEYIYLTDFDGLLFAHSFDDGFPESLADHLLQTSHPPSLSLSSIHGKIIENDTPLIKGMYARLHVGANQKAINALINKARTDIIQIGLIVAIFCLGFALLIGYRMSRPLNAL